MARPDLVLLCIMMYSMLIFHPSFSSGSTSNRRAIYLPLNRLDVNSPTVINSKLPSARMPLHDDLGKTGYYSTHVMIGTPPKKFDLVVDTGSALTFVPCAACKNCGQRHQDPKFYPELSMTYEPVTCDIDCTCDTDRVQCVYDTQYGDESTSSGVLGTDIFSFSDQNELAPQLVVFGCEKAETGSLSDLAADGIMGLGRGDFSIIDHLFDRGVISNSFSLCYGGMDVGGGTMVLGGVSPLKDMIFVDSKVVDSSPLYYVVLKELHVAGKPLSLDPGVFDGEDRTVLDSGTTFAYFPEAAFKVFKQAMINELHSLKQISGPNHPGQSDICFSGAGSDRAELSKYFPTLDMVFESGEKLSLFPENYLFRHPNVLGGYCLGIYQNGEDPSTLLGAIVVRNTFVTYDRDNEKIGFVKTNCSSVWERLNATGSLLPGSSAVEGPKPPALLPSAATPTGGIPYETPGRKKHHTAVALIIVVAMLPGLLIFAIWFVWRCKPQTLVLYNPVRSAVPEQELQPS